MEIRVKARVGAPDLVQAAGAAAPGSALPRFPRPQELTPVT